MLLILSVRKTVSQACFPVACIFLCKVRTRCAWLAAVGVVRTNADQYNVSPCAWNLVSLLLLDQITICHEFVIKIACWAIPHEIPHVCVCVFITAVPITKLFARGGGGDGGHVLRETTSLGLCELVCPSRTNERWEEGYCVKEGGGEERERERERAGEVRLYYHAWSIPGLSPSLFRTGALPGSHRMYAKGL